MSKMTENPTAAATGHHNSAQCISKVIRIPSLKRGKTEEPMSHRVKLERVLGLTVCTNSGLDCDPSSDTIAYPAGCTVVLFNPSKNRQNHLLNTSRKTVTCVRFSPDGRLLATGENGHLPSVRVWDLADGAQVAEFTGHKYGISCVAFSPSQKYLVSVGCEHDMIVNVWEWKSGVKVASNKVSNKVKAVAFSENGNYFVTAGNRLVKFWYLEYSRSAKYKEPVPLMGRSAILGEQRNNDFCDVVCGKGEMADSTYAITRSGLLCEFNNRRLLDKWVELRTPCANCMTVSKTFIFIGCAEGIVRCFSPQTLQYITTLPRPHYLGVDIAQGTNISHTTTHPNNAKYPDTIAVSFDENNMKLTCVYNDHSLYIWDVKDIKRVGKTHSFLYHSACIWGVEMYPDGEKNSAMPLGSFLTCSSDDTIRVWNLDSPDPQTNTSYRTNIYSNELLKVMYVDPEMNFLKDLDITKGEKGDSTSYDGRNGVRSIRISPDGRHLASGDREGNIRITDLHSLEEIVRIEAHDGEVLCVEYSNSDDPRKKYLASASRDRLIHVFSVDEGYKLVQTLDDHSSSITAVRFLNNNNQLQMVSCGADKSIIFRTLQKNIPGSDFQHTFVREQITAAKTTLYDMEGDCTQKHVLTACQDRNIRVYSVNTSKHTKTFKGSVGEDGSLIKVSLDPSGILVATSSTDKTLSIYDYYNTECVATMLGHSELATGLRFTRDCRRLISASGDGCIFVWKMPHDLVVTMRARLAQQVARAGKKLAQLGITIGDNEENDNLQENNINSSHQGSNDSDYRLNMGQLPQWAQKSILDTNIPIIEKSSRSVEAPKGRWAQRAHLEPNYDVPMLDRNFYTQGSMSKEKRLDSDGSKEDSSIDSGTELRSFKHEKRKQFTIAQVTDLKESILKSGEHTEISHQRSRHHTDDSSIGSFKYEDLESTEHDGDIEDISEGESVEETRHQLIYYPPAEDTNSDYTVNAMDVEELRKSQRRTKRPDLLLAHGETSHSVSGSQESDDDEQASTPSGEHSDRKITGSTESLNILSRREKVLKNTFESLSGAELEKEPSPKNKTSLSAKYMSATGVRNSNVIQAAKVTKHEAQSTSKREELQRRIEETRRQLQCVGYRSNLESSQSIQDLSPRGMSYNDSRKMSSLKPFLQVPNIGKQTEFNTLPHSYKKTSTNKTNPNSKRPFCLNLSTDFSVSNTFCKANRAKNLSLPESPVYEDLSPPFCSTDFVKSSDIRAKRHSYGFFIDIKSDYNIQSKEDCKSLESLSEVGQSAVMSVDEPKSELSDFSSDSLESCAEFPPNKLPRRCVSEYQIFSRGIIQQGEKTKFHSEENILADDEEMMDDNNDELNGRHSSASFFLRCKEACRSTESILTDESEYQYLFTNRDKEEFHSTESILTDISDSVSKDIPKDLPEKQPVLRTRSLQDSTEFKGDEHFGEQTDSFYSNPSTGLMKDGRPKTEFFFIPLGGECVKTLPDFLVKRFQNKESSSSCQPDTYPIVTHKPPKPHQKPNKSLRKSWQKVPVNTVGKQIEAVKARAAVWKKDEDMKRVWQTENCSKDPGLNSMREDLQNIFSNGKPVKSMSLQHMHHKQNDDLVCRELKPLEFIVKEVIIDDISCAKKCDLNNSSYLSNDKNDSSSICQKVIISSVDNKTLEEMQKISDIKMNCIYEGKNVNPINLTKTQSSGGKLRPRMPSVKLLSQNFERISVRNVQDEGAISGEDNSIAPMGYDSGSSTPATSSSCTNSPKRLTNQLAKRLNNNNILPSKCNAVVVDADVSGGIRRACSLSDLSKSPSKMRAIQPSQSVTAGKTINVRNTRNTSRHLGTKPSSSMTRSTSVGTLNQSDSESEQSHSQSVRRVMRPTISSLNKAISGQKSSTVNRRRGMTSSYSTMALNKPDNEDSSSEEGKNNCLPQQRSSSTDRSGNTAMNRRPAVLGLGRSGSERDLAHSQRLASRTFIKPVRSASGIVRSTSNLEDASSKAAYNVDFENTPVPQLLDNMKELLDTQHSMILEFMNQMQHRLADESVDMSERSAWKNSFQQAIQEYIKSLSKAAMTNKMQEALDSLPSDSASNSEVVSMVQQCSDILISMVQKKMSEPKN